MSSEEKNEWTCSKCSYKNKNMTYLACKVCLTRRDSTETGSDMNTSSDESSDDDAGGGGAGAGERG